MKKEKTYLGIKFILSERFTTSMTATVLFRSAVGLEKFLGANTSKCKTTNKQISEELKRQGKTTVYLS